MLQFQTTLDLFWLAMTIFVGCLTLLLSIFFLRIIGILGDVRLTTKLIKEIAELANKYAWKPIEVMGYLKEFLVEYLEKKKEK